MTTTPNDQSEQSPRDFAAYGASKSLPASMLIAKLQQELAQRIGQFADWRRAPAWARWWAVDSDGWAWWYDDKPRLDLETDTIWFMSEQGVNTKPAGRVPLDTVGIDWTETLMQRPVEVQP